MEDIKTLGNSELIQFFISFFTYSKLFENYYILIHDELLTRIDSIDIN